MANKFQIKRTSTTGLLPNTTNSGNTSYIAAGELAINLIDEKMVSSNGSATFEIGANLTNLSVQSSVITANLEVTDTAIINTNSITIGNSSVNTIISAGSLDIGGDINANGSVGAAGQVLKSGGVGANAYWSTVTGGSGTPGGSDTYVQFNDGDAFGGDAGLTYNKTTDALTVAGSVLVGANLIANTSALLVGNSSVNAVLTQNSFDIDGTIAAGNTTLVGFINVSSTANVGGAVNLRGTLAVNGAVTVPNTAALGNTTVTGFINVSSTANVGGATNLRGDATVNGALTVSNTASLGNTTITGFANVTSTIQGGSSLTIAGSASGITTLAAGNTTITGFINVSSTANVGGATNLRGDATVNGALTVANTAALGNTTVTGFINVSSTANVGGATNLRGDATVNGALTVANTAALGNTTITGFINVSSSANIGANVQLSTSTVFVGNSTVNTTQTSSLIQVSNSTSTANLTASALTVGSAVVNSTILTIGTGNFSTSANVGANVQLSTSTVFVGNSTVNASHTSSLMQVSNSTSTANLTASGMTIGTIVANTTGLFVGANVFANASAFDVGNTVVTSALLTLGGQINANGGVGTAGQVLKSGATGNVYWDTASGGTPGGSNTEIQFNDSGAFGGSAGLTFNKSTNAVIVSNTLQVINKLQVGPATGYDFSAVAELVVDGNTNTYLQSVTQNSNTGNNASSEFVATADSGNDSVNFVSFGINGSNYNQAAFNIGGALDAYLYTSNSDLTIGTAANNGAIVFHANGTTATDEVARITTTGLRVGNATVNTTITSADFTKNGVSIVPFGQQSIWIPATAMYTQTTTGAAAGTVEAATNDQMIKTFDFDTTTQEFVQFAVQMPKSYDLGTIVARFVWSHATTTTNFGVAWQIQGYAYSDAVAIDQTWGSAVAVTDTGGTTDTLYLSPETAAVTIGGTPGAEEHVIFRVARVPANGSDNMAIDARLHGVKIHYTVNAATDT